MFSNESLKNYIKKAGVFLKAEAMDVVEDYIYMECKKAVDEQKYNDIIKAVMVLLEVGVKEDTLYELLNRFWNIDSRKEAMDYISIGRYVEWPYIRLRGLLKKQGFNNIEILKYMRENNVKMKLERNPEFCEFEDEKLKTVIEK